MSCFIVSTSHIAYLAGVALGCQLEYDWGGQTHRIDTPEEALRIAEAMRLENNASYTSRYENRYPEDLNDQPITADMIWPVTKVDTTAAQIVKSVDCLNYQSCEHSDWESCQAKTFIYILKARATSWAKTYKEQGYEYPIGYDDAEWGCCPKFDEKLEARLHKPSPMMEQWQAVREQLPDDHVILWQLGDFYELFHEDAQRVTKLLNLTLTHRNKVPMAGIPYHCMEKMAAEIRDTGLTVVIVECTNQDDVEKLKAAPRREITRVIKPPERLSLKDKRKSARVGLSYLTPYLSATQLAILRENITCEEGEYFCDLICDLVEQFMLAPRTYQQDGKGDEAIAHSHYFVRGYDCYITELDKGDDGDMTQHQAFGYARFSHMPECAEMGYVSLPEIFQSHAELDLHWTPKTIAEVKQSFRASDDAESEALAIESAHA